MADLPVHTKLLRRFVEMFELAWEDLIFDRCSDLPTLFEINNIDPRWLPLLAPLLGFTQDLSFTANDTELRRMLNNAATFWDDKPTEKAVVNDAVGMVTGNRFRAANYFDFRMQIDKTVITEELEDFDPSVIDFPSSILTGDDLTYAVVQGEGAGSFEINDLPSAVLQGSVYQSDEDFSFLAITEDLNNPDNVGVYRIYSTMQGSKIARISPLNASFPIPATLDYDNQTVDWTIGETITGDTSGATAEIVEDDDQGAAGTLKLTNVTGLFINDEALTGSSGGAADADGVLQSSGTARWRLFGFMDEFVTEVRLVDPGAGQLAYDGQTVAFTPSEKVVGAISGATAVIVSDDNIGTSGTLTLRSINGRFVNNEALTDTGGGAAVTKGLLQGVLNRDLLAFLMNLVRANGERVDVVYINFLDNFITPLDLDQWAVTPDADGVTVPSPGGQAELLDGYRMIDADSESATWGDQIVAWKIITDDATSVIELTFWTTDEENHYFVRMDYASKEVSLWEKTAGADTQIGSTVSLPFLKVGVQDVVRVDVLAEGADTRIRVKVDGEVRIDEGDSPASHTMGSVGAYAATGDFALKLVEVNVLPTEIQRVGPNP